MIRPLTKGWNLRCYKDRRRDLNVYPNIYYLKAAFFTEGTQRSILVVKSQTNKAMKIL